MICRKERFYNFFISLFAILFLRKHLNEQKNLQQSLFFYFVYFINLNTSEAVLNIITQASDFTKFIFMERKTRN